MNENGHPDALSLGNLPIKIWEHFGGRGALSGAQLSPIGLALETILHLPKPGQHRIVSGADSPATELRSGVR